MIYLASVADCSEEMLLPHVDKERKQYAAKYKQSMDRIRSLGVAVLLRYALKEETGILGYVLKHDEKQKPYLTLADGEGAETAGMRDIAADRLKIPQISLSHAGDYVAVAIDRLPVGIDIEQIRPCKESLVKRFFSEAERAYVEQLQGVAFTAIWTLKESFVKATGMGLSLGLENFSVEQDEPGSRRSEPGEPERFRVRQTYDTNDYYGVILPSPEGYQLSVCFHNNSETAALIEEKYKIGDLVHEICLSALLSCFCLHRRQMSRHLLCRLADRDRRRQPRALRAICGVIFKKAAKRDRLEAGLLQTGCKKTLQHAE